MLHTLYLLSLLRMWKPLSEIEISDSDHIAAFWDDPKTDEPKPPPDGGT